MAQTTTEKTIYQVNVFFRNNDVNLVLQFRDMETARSTASDILKQNPPGNILVSDHFGHEVALNTSDVIMTVATDLKRELEAQAEVQILRAIAQVKLQNRAKSDPVLKFLTDTRTLN